MHIGFIGLVDPQSIQSYSGTPYFMAHALMRHGCEISFFLQLKEQAAALVHVKDKMTRLLTGKHIIPERDPRIAYHYPEQINEAARKHSIQAVLGTSSFYMVTRDCSIPSVFWGDTTVAGVLDKYPYYKNLTKRSLRHCHNLEQAALSTSALAVFSNQWAADVACASYSFDERKVRVIPYGANLSSGLDADDIAECLHRRDARECELLFVGVDWERKGAQIAIDTATMLRARGIDARLTLVGCVPPRGISLPQYVTVIGKIDKATLEGQSELTTLYMQSHFLILPSRAECAAVSLSEASAHGVPSLSTDVGGNGTLVQNGVNGYLLPLEAGPADYAECVLQLLGDSCKYSEMCWSSYERFQTELNWDVAVSRLIAELNSVLSVLERTDGQYACSRAS
jgi:glycosyltransferase involved in cell wall biosynthesis